METTAAINWRKPYKVYEHPDEGVIVRIENDRWMILDDYIGEGGYAEFPDSDDFYTEVCKFIGDFTNAQLANFPY